jgi:hypothetical protein
MMVQDQLYRTISEYPLDFVEQRLIKKGGFDEATAKAAVEELKKFLYICTVEEDKPIAMISSTVDEAWHTFILFTKEYENFCRNIAGRFLHHQPIISDDDMRDVKIGVQNFIKSYQKYFGEISTIWKEHSDDVEAICIRDPNECWQPPCDYPKP